MPFCARCGKPVDRESIFCPHCGERITLPAIDPSNESITEEEFKLFIGKQADYYLYKFRNFSARGANSFAVTWNWSAFFLGFIWMLYRKMYLWALIAFFIAFTPVALPLTMIGWGIVGNYLYYLHARKKILEYKSRQFQIPVPLSLSDLGGANHWVWFVGFIFFLFLLAIGVLGFLLFLHMMEYSGFIKPEIVEI